MGRDHPASTGPGRLETGPAEEAAQGQTAGIKAAVTNMAGHGESVAGSILVTEWERGFASGLLEKWHGPLTPKQA
jgi:hypothetical protein